MLFYIVKKSIADVERHNAYGLVWCNMMQRDDTAFARQMVVNGLPTVSIANVASVRTALETALSEYVLVAVILIIFLFLVYLFIF